MTETWPREQYQIPRLTVLTISVNTLTVWIISNSLQNASISGRMTNPAYGWSSDFTKANYAVRQFRSRALGFCPGRQWGFRGQRFLLNETRSYWRQSEAMQKDLSQPISEKANSRQSPIACPLIISLLPRAIHSLVVGLIRRLFFNSLVILMSSQH